MGEAEIWRRGRNIAKSIGRNSRAAHANRQKQITPVAVSEVT